jgi:hypothetical protein
MATVSIGKQGRVRKRASDGRLKANREKKNRARDEAAWNEFAGNGQGRRRPELVFTEYIELYPDSVGITDPCADDIDYQNDDCKDSLVACSDGPVFTGRGTKRVDSFKKDRRLGGADSEKRVAKVDWQWVASDDALWNKQEARKTRRDNKVEYWPPHPCSWRPPLPPKLQAAWRKLVGLTTLLATWEQVPGNGKDARYMWRLGARVRRLREQVFAMPILFSRQNLPIRGSSVTRHVLVGLARAMTVPVPAAMPAKSAFSLTKLLGVVSENAALFVPDT